MDASDCSQVDTDWELITETLDSSMRIAIEVKEDS